MSAGRINSDFIDCPSGPCNEVFATRLYRIERLGSCRRLVFATERVDRDGVTWLEPVVSVVVPAEALASILKSCAGAMQDAPIETGAFEAVASRPN